MTEVASTPTPPEIVAPEAESDEIGLYCSCVRTTREIYPEIPLQDAIEFKSNGRVENSEIIILQYKSKKSDGYVWHIAPYKLVDEKIHIYNEGNFEECTKTEREIGLNDPAIIGFFDIELWKEILKLPKSAQEVIRKESRYQHYKTDGSILKSASNDYGLGQFQRKTWNWFNKLRAEQGLPKLYDIFDPFLQVQMMAWAWDNNLMTHWITYEVTK